MNLVIDVGNTRTKLAVFQEDKVLEVKPIQSSRIISEVKKIIQKHKIVEAIIASVGHISQLKLQKLQELVSLLVVSSTTKIPFQNVYKTPTTLGVDRIALVSAATKIYNQKNCLIIDAGTCITYDFINKNKQYLGGAIAPGVAMRYKALHEFTAKLPSLKKEIPNNFIGNSTEQSIHSGVVNGVVNEINGVITQYKQVYQDLTVVLTGGDAIFLSKQLKSSIFANQNFLLLGLNEILIFNNNL